MHSLVKLLPTICILCGDTSPQNICKACQNDLPILSQTCERCANVLANSAQYKIKICGSCLTNPPPFDRTYALFPYEPPIIQLIVKLKFQNELNIAQAFGELLAQYIEQVWYHNKKLPDLILPVPLHANRIKERGFNQAVEIARPIAKKLRIPIDYYSVVRSKETATQSKILQAKVRNQNLKAAFTANKNYSGLFVAIIDDVVTTGYTVRSLSKLLKKHGVNRLHIWSIARRMLQQFSL